jgi:Fic family protein
MTTTWWWTAPRTAPARFASCPFLRSSRRSTRRSSWTDTTTAIADGDYHPVLLIGLFVLDLLTIHPFADGNGRVVRAVTNALLEDAGYGVGRYVSLEQIIAGTADDYDEALLRSTHGWHDRSHDPWPWLTYFVSTLSTAYDTFEARASSDRSTGTKQDRVRDYVMNHAPDVFKIGDVRVALPGISDPTIRIVLEALKQDGWITPDGTGRGAVWRQSRGRADWPMM